MPPISSASSFGSADVPTGVPGSVADPAIDRLARNAHQAVDRVAGTAGTAVERVRTGVQDAMSTVNEKVQDLSATRDAWTDGARERVRERPLATLAVALAAGFLLARFLR